MRSFPYLLLAALATVTACGGDDDGATPDGGTDAPPAGVCGAPVTTISTYPATYAGVVLGQGADLAVAEGACADERGYYGTSGDDHAIALTGLTAGTTYVLDLATTEDILMYVTTACDAAGPTAGACLLLVDERTTAEQGEFVAPAGGEVTVIIDTPDGVTPATGMYTLGVRAAECLTSATCPTNEPVCDDFTCVQCTSSFECDAAATPVCDGATNTCVAGNTMCTGDDAGEQDDGPAAARALTYPTATVPTVQAAAVCSLPAVEGDWYTFTATAAGTLRVSVAWTAAGADLDYLVYDASGEAIALGFGEGPGPEAAVVDVPAAGTYYIEVYQYEPSAAAAATPYTLTLALPDCEASFDCPLAAAPVCDVGQCGAGPALCTGDDAADTGTADDGPAAARSLTGAVGAPVALTGAVCNAPAIEADWYRVVTTTPGEGLIANLSWTAGPDLDVYVWDSEGRLLGTSFWLNPEVVTLTYLPVGTYYLSVQLASQSTVTAAAPYTLTATRTTAQTCATRTDCAATYATQLYRGSCTAGACAFIAAGTAANGSACDSPDDCMSGECSYAAFEADAQDSVCTRTCTADADCAALGTGYTCTVGFSTNVCVPSCTSDLECGANPQSDALTSGQPWDYFTCTVATGVCGS